MCSSYEVVRCSRPWQEPERHGSQNVKRSKSRSIDSGWQFGPAVCLGPSACVVLTVRAASRRRRSRFWCRCLDLEMVTAGPSWTGSTVDPTGRGWPGWVGLGSQRMRVNAVVGPCACQSFAGRPPEIRPVGSELAFSFSASTSLLPTLPRSRWRRRGPPARRTRPLEEYRRGAPDTTGQLGGIGQSCGPTRARPRGLPARRPRRSAPPDQGAFPDAAAAGAGSSPSAPPERTTLVCSPKR